MGVKEIDLSTRVEEIIEKYPDAISYFIENRANPIT